LIHEITGEAIPKEIPGVKEVHAVDAAGVHPLLLAIGSERYTPYNPTKQPAELLTIANHILGTGQLSLAKFLFITADDTNQLSTHHEETYFKYILERLHLDRDIHFHTNTTIDTLDYSGDGLNTGSKVVIAAYGEKIRALDTEIPVAIQNLKGLNGCTLVMPGVIAIQSKKYQNPKETTAELEVWDNQLKDKLIQLQGSPLIIWCDDASFVADKLNNFLWVSFTRANPANDIHGIDSFYKNKHWGCNGPLIVDARVKPHHAPPVEIDSVTNKKVDKLFSKGGSLYNIR
jgi:4-hydroxy-3-polyprenylbenzoate decarboxylase